MSAANDLPPIPGPVLRRERLFVASLFVAAVGLGLYGYLTIPTEEDLVRTATTHADDLARIKATNAMIRRGYWDDKTFKEFEQFNEEGPYAIRQFIADMHGDLVKPQNRHMWKK